MAAALLCLSSVIHNEAGGEPLKGQIAVANVVLNRVASPRFPDSICSVVNQRGQFSWVGKKPFTDKKIALAKEVLAGHHENNVPKALFFTNFTVRFKRKVLYTIGRHRFYE
jgi:N-acetylmuramoyl-L-alanine amidase